MNGAIADLLRARLEGLSFVDKTAGLVRPVSRSMSGKVKVFPVGCDVEDPLACSDSTIQDLVPDGRYMSILYFEDRGGVRRTQDRTRGVSFTSRLRLVFWMNTGKIGAACTVGDAVQQLVIEAIEGDRYASDPFKDVKHRVVNIAPKEPAIFSRYTYDEAARQFLTYPFDYFALDIETVYRLIPGCADPLTPEAIACWQPSASGRKLHPNEFTCEQLLDPVFGLTTEQLGPECLDCSGSGPCDLCDTIQAATAEEIDGCLVGEQREEVKALVCDPVVCDPLTWTLVNTNYDTLNSGSVPDPCGESLPITAPDGMARTSLNDKDVVAVPSGGTATLPKSVIDYIDADGNPQETSAYDTDIIDDILRPDVEIPSRVLKYANNTEIGPITLADLVNDTLPAVTNPITPGDSTVQRKDSAGTDIGTPITVPYASSGYTITAPDGTFQRKDSAGADIGTPIAVKSNESGVVATCPDGTVTIKNLGGTTLGTQAVKSNGAADYVAPIPLKFGWGAGDADTLSWTVTADEAGTYDTYTQTGTNGTVTYSKNGGAYAALTGTIVLAVGDTITVRRTTTTNAGSIKWEP